MKAAAFDYVRARDAAHAVEVLTAAGGYAKPVAGGQSLGPMLNLRLAEPDLLVDIRACPDLRGWLDEGDTLLYGAAVTHAEIEDGAAPDPCGGWLAAAARRIAYRAVRNRGTLGGSLAHADPAADWLAIMILLGAEIVVLGPGGERRVGLAELVTGPFATTLAADEILTGVRVAKRPERARYGYCKLAMKVGEFARALCVAFDDPERGESRAVLGAIERTPIVIEDLSGVSDMTGAETVVVGHLPGLDAPVARLHAVALSRAVRALDGGGAS